MTQGKYTIACVLTRPGGYFDGHGWNKEIRSACLYTVSQALTRLQELMHGEPKAAMTCIIQDAAFNYFDGKKFVYDLSQVKTYSLREAEEELSRFPN